jgi:hypothetical protein
LVTEQDKTMAITRDLFMCTKYKRGGLYFQIYP